MQVSRTNVLAALAAFAVIACSPASDAQSARAAIVVEDPWAAATNPGATVAGGYVTLRNPRATPDRLISASSPRADRVELHEMSMDGGMMRMRPVTGIDVPAGASATLRPGGLHIMFINIDEQFQDGQRVPVTLTFERAGNIHTVFVVRPRPVGGGHEH